MAARSIKFATAATVILSLTGCHQSVHENTYAYVNGNEDLSRTFDPRPLIGKANSQLPLRPGIKRSDVRALMKGVTSSYESGNAGAATETFSFSRHVRSFHFMDIEEGILGFDDEKLPLEIEVV